jgi:hypothetical protein
MTKLPHILAFFILGFVSCTPKTHQNDTAPFALGIPLVELTHPKLDEISGMVESIQQPKHFWVINDSGGKPHVYLINEKAELVFTIKLKGVKNRDWEDIAIGPGPDSTKTYLYIADIGDNRARHPEKFIYRIEEPLISTFDTTSTLTIKDVDKITVRLPDEQKDSETLLLDFATKDLYIISKREEPVYLYRIPYPQSTTEVITAEVQGSIPYTQIVAGDISEDGSEILLKNYSSVYYWKADPSKTLIENLQQEPTLLPYEEEPQGESITFSRDGKGYYTLSEVISTRKTYLLYYPRR